MRNINIWNGTPLGYNKEYDDVNLGLPRLDEFAINDGKKHPCILIIPGGGYDHLSDHEGENVIVPQLGIIMHLCFFTIIYSKFQSNLGSPKFTSSYSLLYPKGIHFPYIDIAS